MHQLVNESNRGQLVVAASRHYVQQACLDLVIDAIQKVLNQARGAERSAAKSP